ncbi:MAG: YkvA family protein [Candidatus Cryptobacteroides sp.]
MRNIFNTISERFSEIDLATFLNDSIARIAYLAKKLGRVATRQLLILYYVLADGDLPSGRKALVYAALAYVLIPGDLIPRRVFHLLGLTDDALAIAYVIRQVRDNITPQILQKVDMQLDKWFGYEVMM